jgi:hypothetical protein
MSIWSNAFKINSHKEPDDEEKEFILKVVKKIKEKKLEDIAILAAEGTRPIHTIASNFLYFAQPTLGFIFSKEDLTKLSKILENPGALDFFKENLEKREEK